MVLGAEDLRMAYFRLLGDDDRAAKRKSKFLDGEWNDRWLPAWDGLLSQNGDSGYLIGTSLTQADVAVWDALDAMPIRDTDGATRPAISPNGQEVVFQAGGSIRIVPIQGGVSRTLTSTGEDVPRWSPDGAWIYFTNAADGVSRTPSIGGAVEIITEVDTAGGDEAHVMVDVLPGDRVVYQVLRPGAVSRIQAVNLETGEVRDVTPGRYPIYSRPRSVLRSPPHQCLTRASPLSPVCVIGIMLTRNSKCTRNSLTHESQVPSAKSRRNRMWCSAPSARWRRPLPRSPSRWS